MFGMILIKMAIKMMMKKGIKGVKVTLKDSEGKYIKNN